MIQLAWTRGLQRIIVESDSLVAVNLIKTSCEATHPYASLILQIRGLMVQAWEIKVQHTLREANQVADHLANMAHDLELGTHVLSDPPHSCRDLLLFDVMGVAYPRHFHL